MCPSYMVTQEEEHSTRGPGPAAVRDARRHRPRRRHRRRMALRRTSSDALDLCLACKGCKADCPVDVDMATYKAEFLSHHYAGPAAPARALLDGLAARWRGCGRRYRAPAGQRARPRPRPGLVGEEGRPESTRAVRCRCSPPRPSSTGSPAHPARRRRAGRGGAVAGHVHQPPSTPASPGPPSRCSRTPAGGSVVPERRVCCGLTWISTGQLDTAKRVLRRTVDDPAAAPAGRARSWSGWNPAAPPCSAATPRDLFPHDQDVARLRQQTVTLAELLTEHTPSWRPPRIDRTAHIQTHCHHHAVMGYDADTATAAPTPAWTSTVLDSGCCGLAGNFGFEAGHYEVSEACAERVLLPAVRSAADTDVILADGFSCRTQIQQSDTDGRHGGAPRRTAGRRTGRRRRRRYPRAAMGRPTGSPVAAGARADHRRRGRGCPGSCGIRGASMVALTASAYTVPTDAPEGDGTLAWNSTTLVLVASHRPVTLPGSAGPTGRPPPLRW